MSSQRIRNTYTHAAVVPPVTPSPCFVPLSARASHPSQHEQTRLHRGFDHGSNNRPSLSFRPSRVARARTLYTHSSSLPSWPAPVMSVFWRAIFLNHRPLSTPPLVGPTLPVCQLAVRRSMLAMQRAGGGRTARMKHLLRKAFRYNTLLLLDYPSISLNLLDRAGSSPLHSCFP